MASRRCPSVKSQTDTFKISSEQSTYLIARYRANEFFSTPPKSFFKGLFQGSDLGEALRKMSSVKSNPEGLKVVECERDVGGKNSPDPVHS